MSLFVEQVWLKSFSCWFEPPLAVDFGLAHSICHKDYTGSVPSWYLSTFPNRSSERQTHVWNPGSSSPPSLAPVSSPIHLREEDTYKYDIHSGRGVGENRRVAWIYRAQLKGGPRLRECCRQSQAEVVSNSRNKIHKTWLTEAF